MHINTNNSVFQVVVRNRIANWWLCSVHWANLSDKIVEMASTLVVRLAIWKASTRCSLVGEMGTNRFNCIFGE